MPGGSVAFKAKDGRLVLVRPLKARDLDSVLEYANTLVREKRVNRNLGVASFDRRLTREFERRFLRSITDGARRRELVDLGAFYGDRMIGICVVRRRLPKDVRHTGTLGVTVLDGFRGVGIGEKLVTAALEEAHRIGVWMVELEVLSMNSAARRLYEKAGFTRAGLLPNKFHRDGRFMDILVMYTDLRRSDKSPAGRRPKS